MPRCKVDPALRDQVYRFISISGLTINGAAIELGINRTTFWRFCETGRATSRTRLRLCSALEKRNKRSTESVSVNSDASDSPAIQAPAMLRLLAERELKQIRRACEGVLALIDVYEAQHAGQKIEHAPGR